MHLRLWLCHTTIGVHPPNRRLPCLCSDLSRTHRLARFYWLLFSPLSGLCFLGSLGVTATPLDSCGNTHRTPLHRLLSFIALAGNHCTGNQTKCRPTESKKDNLRGDKSRINCILDIRAQKLPRTLTSRNEPNRPLFSPH
jgi:hypothetical protein